MAKFKISNKQADGTLTDQRIGSNIYQGATGGIPQFDTSTGVKTVLVRYRTSANVLHANAYIISAKGAHEFRVANAIGAVSGATHSNASVTTATLVNLATPVTASTMSITGYNTSNVAFNVSRITNKYVYDFAGNRYRYKHSTQVATSTFANVSVQ